MPQLDVKSIFVFLCILICASAKDCFLRYDTDFPKVDSVVISKSSSGYDLIEPKNQGIVLKENQQIGVACPGNNNYIVIDRLAFEAGTCVKDKTLHIGNKDSLLSNLGCNTKVTGDYFRTSSRCGSTGIVNHIGHKIQGQFKILFDVCYDEDKGNALYSTHIIYGSAINYAYKTETRPDFKKVGLPTGVTGDEYGQTAQINRFKEILGSGQKYIDIKANSYLARGHLAPDADMVYGSSKYSTYFYINAAPQWQKINNGNWKSVEGCMRKLASTLQEDIQVYTGTHDVLELEGKQIYLANGKLPVPKFIWKVFYSSKSKSGIAFVSVNNPFAKISDPGLYICGTNKKVCDDNSWGTTNWKDVSRGLVYCCEIDDLRKAVPNVPSLRVDRVQKGLATRCS